MRFEKYISLSLMLLFFSTLASAKIVFDSRRDGISGIYVMDDDGSNVKLLTDTHFPLSPSWSPDGKHIVFDRRDEPHNDHRHLFLMNADGSNIHRLTGPSDAYDDWHASFSPDGGSIIFFRLERKNNKNIPSVRLMNLESGKIKKISDLGVNQPTFSPDGKKIVFSPVVVIGKSGTDIWIMEADGGNPRELLPSPPQHLLVNRSYPRWSMDGRKLLYIESQYKRVEIDGDVDFIPQGFYYYIYDFTSRQSRRLNIPKDYRGGGIDWTDNDKSVVFSAVKIKLKEPLPRQHLVPYNTYKYHIASAKITRLTEHPGSDGAFDWISDDVLPVSAVDKKKVTWGMLKQ